MVIDLFICNVLYVKRKNFNEMYNSRGKKNLFIEKTNLGKFINKEKNFF